MRTEQVATLRGHRCRYHVTGPADGPRVLLIMGFGMSGDAWRPQVEGLGQACRVAWYDCRGLGRSQGQRVASVGALADDAAALMDHLGWPTAHAVGVSMGGMIAQHLALRHRARLRSLTLIATHPGGRGMWPTRQGLRLFLTANTRKGEGRLRALQHLLFPGPAREALSWTPEELAVVLAPSSKRTRVGHLAAILRHDTREALRALDLPTLVLRPDHDILVPPHGSDVLAASIPGARLVSFPQAGHGITRQEAVEVNRLILEHVRAAG